MQHSNLLRQLELAAVTYGHLQLPDTHGKPQQQLLKTRGTSSDFCACCLTTTASPLLRACSVMCAMTADTHHNMPPRN